MSETLRRHKYAVNRILIPAARILSPEFNAAYILVTGSQIELLRNLLDYANRETTFVDEYHDGYYLSPDDSDMDAINAIVAALEEILMADVLGTYDAYVFVKDTKAKGVSGGTSEATVWRTRDINDEVSDVQGVCSIGSNQITLDQGTYRCLIVCPHYRIGRTITRLYNITDDAMMLLGSSTYSNNAIHTAGAVVMVGRFTLDAQKVLEVQQVSQNTHAKGFGFESNFDEETYTTVELWKEA